MNSNRYKAARYKHKLAPLFQCAIAQGLLTQSDWHLDYGCGKGTDFNLLRQMGYKSHGWDYYYYPFCPGCEGRQGFDVISLNYVLNVIEDEVERLDVLKRCWNATKRVLLVAVPHQIHPLKNEQSWEGGRINTRGCFNHAISTQQFYSMLETHCHRLPIFLGPDMAAIIKNSPTINVNNKYQLIAILINHQDQLNKFQKQRLKKLIRL